MIRKLGIILITLAGAGIGMGFIRTLESLSLFDSLIPMEHMVYVYAGSGIIFGLIFLLLSKRIVLGLRKIFREVEDEMQKIPISDILLGSLGLIMGLLIAYLLSTLLSKIPVFGVVLMVLSYIILGYIGLRVLIKKKQDIIKIFDKFRKNRDETIEKVMEKQDSSEKQCVIKPKILDTSVIIDGRIYEICKAGFLEGTIIIPEFVLKELQLIADSSDDLKRVRGRRGLDILQQIQKELDMDVQISDKDYESVKEVDLKLLKLAQEIDGKVVTSDYNLNKVAEVHGVTVLNINELSNAVKPMAIPGDNMVVNVVKKGKEANQGVAYLDDGTMIVVEGGKDYVGQEVNLMVTSVLQTSAGRMIFGKPKDLKLMK